ncbi:MAG: hypothetical protein FJ304_09915 [Planctomycetes bacterium]|nr:hypothetical protein [Planctomycetota bacterium]
MPRFAFVPFGALVCALVALAAEPTPVEKQLAVQTAMAAARKHLDANDPAAAVTALENELLSADGNTAFLDLLRAAYRADLARLERAPAPDAERVAQTERKLALLGGAPHAPKPPEPDLGPSVAPPVMPMAASPPPLAIVQDAVAAFKKGDFVGADALFAAVGAAKLTADQKTAWAYCRIKLAADRVAAPTCDAATATAAAQSVADALELASDNPKLTALGREVLKAAQAKAATAPAAAPVAAGDVVETANFRVSHGGNRDLGATVAKLAEAARKDAFERWSGPTGGAWQPKCEIAIHATADAYATATGKPAALTGHATVALSNGRATARRIDLRADDAALAANALPREITHVVLADLFADKPPPRWALEGMAVLAGSPEEISRYTRTLPRCARDGELRPLAALFDLKDVPADKLTGFYCQSVSVAEYLIKLKGERNFKIFLGEVSRYGTAQALKRQYGINGPQALETDWKRACLELARGQAP